jgi:hypothetical protein
VNVHANAKKCQAGQAIQAHPPICGLGCVKETMQIQMFAQAIVFFIQHALMMIQKMKLFARVLNGSHTTKTAILLDIAQPDMF